MATPLLASLALMSSALPAAAPLDELFHNHRIEVPSLSLGAKAPAAGPLLSPPLLPDLPLVPSLDARRRDVRKDFDLKPVMPVLKAPQFDPKLVHAPKDKDTDFKLIVKEVKVAETK